jgi:hypothetical protein
VTQHRVRKLTDGEKQLIQRLRAGLPDRLDPDERPDVPAGRIRRLLVGPRVTRSGAIRPPPKRMVLPRVRVVGSLDLRNVGDDEHGARSLEFDDCIFEDPIELENAHLHSLALRGCKFVELRAACCRVDGNVDFSDVGPIDNERSECRIDLASARISGNLTASGTRLRVVPRPPEELAVSAGDRRYALNLPGAVIEGRVTLQPDFEADGGVSLISARVRGEIWAMGSRLVAGEGPAFNAQSMKADGSVVLRADVDAQASRAMATIACGEVSFFGARIGGVLDLSGARIENAVHQGGAANNARLNLATAAVNGPILLRMQQEMPFHCAGWIGLTGGRFGSVAFEGTGQVLDATDATIRGDFSVRGSPSALDEIHLRDADIRGSVQVAGRIGASLAGPRAGRFVFVANGAKIAGGVAFNAAILYGGVSLDHASIGRGCTLHEARIRGPLRATDATIRGDFSVRGSPSALDEIHLQDADIRGSVQVAGRIGASLAGPRAGPFVFVADGAKIAGVVAFKAAILYGGVSLDHASIGRDCKLQEARIRGPLRADRVKIGGSVEMTRVMLDHEASFGHAEVQGNLALRHVWMRGGRWTARSRFDLQDARIGGEIHMDDFDCESERSRTNPGRVLAVRRHALDCYPGWVLYEVKVDEPLIRYLGGPRGAVLESTGIIGLLAKKHEPVRILQTLMRSVRRRILPHDDIMLLTGASPIIHALNRTGALSLRNVAEAEEYLRFFTCYVWGEAGPFRIISPGRDRRLQRALELGIARLPRNSEVPDSAEDRAKREEPAAVRAAAEALPELRVHPVDVAHAVEYRARGTVIYGTGVFEAEFAIYPDGMVEMLEDWPRLDLEGDDVDRVARPVRFADALVQPEATDGEFPASLGAVNRAPGTDRAARTRVRAHFEIVPPAQLDAIEPELLAVLRPPATQICLRDARADRLDDDDGTQWHGEIALDLDGFSYDRAPRASARDMYHEASSRSFVKLIRRIDDFEHTALIGSVRRRPLASHEGWHIVEIATSLHLAKNGTDFGPDRYRHALLAFLWRTHEGVPAAVVGRGPPQNVIFLDDVRANGSAFDRLEREHTAGNGRTPPDARIGSADTARDYLRLFWQSGKLDGVMYRVIEPGDKVIPPEVAAQDIVRPFVIAKAANGNDYEYSCTLVGGGGRLIDVAGTLHADGTLAQPVGTRHEPTERIRESTVGPYRVLDVEGLSAKDVLHSSAWHAAPQEPQTAQHAGNTARAADDRWEHMQPEDSAGLAGDLLPMIERAAVESQPKYHEVPETPAPAGTLAMRSRAFAARAVTWLKTRFVRSGREASRLDWLRRQYPDGRPNAQSYRPHPYEAAGAAFRNEGANQSARAVLIAKLSTETRLERNWAKNAVGRFFGFWFAYGLSTGRALFGTGFLLAMGVLGTLYLKHEGLLVVDFAPSATVLVRGTPVAAPPGPIPLEIASLVEDAERAATYVPCGRFASSFVYAADVMVPILEFGHARRCQIASTRPEGVTAWHLEPWIWQLLQSVYSVLGAIFVSMTILTISGVLRRRAES